MGAVFAAYDGALPALDALFYEQVTRVEAGYWIPPITGETVWSYFMGVRTGSGAADYLCL